MSLPRYAYVSSGSGQSPPTLVTVNGQTVQVVGSLQGNLGGLHPSMIQPGHGLHHLQTAAVQPQQFYPQPDPGLLQRPQSFAPARFSPRSDPEPGEAEPDNGGQRPGAENAQKRDSFSDSGQDSGHNTPTRGRTITEGLLRFVQDSSVARPQLRQQDLASASVALMPGVRPNLAQPQTPSFQPQPQQLQAFQLSQHQAMAAGVPAGYVLQNTNPALLQQQMQQLQQTPGGYNTFMEGAKVTGRDSVPLHVPALPVSGRESVPLAPVVSMPHAQLPGPGRDSVPGRESVQSMPVAMSGPGRESVPLGAPGQGHGGRDSVQSVPVPVIQSLGPGHLGHHAPLSVLPHPAYIAPGHSMVTLPAHSQYGVKLGTPPSNYIGVPGGQPVMPGYPASATAQYNPFPLQPPTSLAAAPGLYSGEPVTMMRQPIMSTVSQPSSYLQSHHHLATNLQPMPLIQYHPQYHQAPPQLASYPNGVAAPSAPGGVLPQHSLTGSFHESQGSIPVKDEATQVAARNTQQSPYLEYLDGTQTPHFIFGS